MENKQEEKILTDNELLRIIKDLLIIQKCTNNRDIIANIDLVIWQLIIDQLKEKK